MQGITPTIVAIQDTIERLYSMSNQVQEDQLLNTYFNLSTPILPGVRACKAIMFGNDGRESRSSKCSHLYGTLPLLVRPMSSPLTAIEREGYYLRKEITVEDVPYEVYYAKAIPALEAVSTLQYTTYSSPTAPPTLTAIELPPPTYDWSNQLASPSVVRIAGDIAIPFTSIDVASMEAACDLLGISDPVVREIGMVSGVPFTESPGVEELSSAICIYHYSLGSPLVPPGLNMSCGMIGGLSL